MASRWLEQFFFSFVKGLSFVEGSVVIGATGAVSTLKGSGVQAVTRLGVGLYQIQLEDNYNRFLGLRADFSSAQTGSDVTAGAFSVGTPYVITALGTTDWIAAGYPAGFTPQVGGSFVAATVGAGTGTAKAVVASGIYTTELIGTPNATINSSLQTAQKKGALLLIKTNNASGAATDPANGSTMRFNMFLRNSSIKSKGE